MRKGMMRLAVPKPKKPAVLRHEGVMDSWIQLALQQHYVDRRPPWGTPRPVSKGWTPSALGEPNDRLLVAALLGYRGEPISERLQRIFDAGHDIESRWRTRFQDLGVLLGSGMWLPNTAGSPLKFSGKIDLLVRHAYEPRRQFLVEVKSINPEGFRTLPRVEMSPEANFERLQTLQGMVGDRVRKYMCQFQVYLQELQMPEGILLFDNKGNQEYRDYYVKLQPEFVAGLYERLTRMQRYWERAVLPPWSGRQSSTFLATYRPDEEVPVAEVQARMPPDEESY